MTTTVLPSPVTVGDYPIGTILPFAGSLNEEQLETQGWMYCNGDSISRTQHADLFAVIGSAFGNGDGVSTFNIPNLRGYFPRGADNSASVDPDAGSRGASRPGGNTGPIVGSAQGYATVLPGTSFTAQMTGAHTHSVDHVPTDNSSYPIAGSYQAIWNSDDELTANAGAHSHKITGGDAETVPVNAYVYFLIKFRDVTTPAAM